MRCESIGQGLDQVHRLLTREAFRFLGHGGIVDGVIDFVGQVARLLVRPERDRDR